MVWRNINGKWYEDNDYAAKKANENHNMTLFPTQTKEDTMAPKSTPTTISMHDSVALPSDLFLDTGNYYLSEDEKVAHIEAGTRFFITAVDYDAENQFGPRYVVGIQPADVDNAGIRGWAFAAGNQNRDNALVGLAEVLTSSGKRVGPVKFVQKGNFRTIVSAATAD
jgi:hypothetical protein